MSLIIPDSERRRYSKQISLTEIGLEGQKKLREAKVLVIGAGGLGGPVLQYLTAAGVGNIGVSDEHTIEEVNLPHQPIYSDNNIGKLKTVVVKEKLQNQNKNVSINIHNILIKNDIALQILKEYDIIVECTDNIKSRYIINDYAIQLGKPVVYGSIYKYQGQVSVFNYNEGPSYRCFFPENDDKIIPEADSTGIFSPITGVIGTLQAVEVIKMILGLEGVLSGKMLFYNALSTDFYKVNFKKKTV